MPQRGELRAKIKKTYYGRFSVAIEEYVGLSYPMSLNGWDLSIYAMDQGRTYSDRDTAEREAKQAIKRTIERRDRHKALVEQNPTYISEAEALS